MRRRFAVQIGTLLYAIEIHRSAILNINYTLPRNKLQGNFAKARFLTTSEPPPEAHRQRETHAPTPTETDAFPTRPR